LLYYILNGHHPDEELMRSRGTLGFIPIALLTLALSTGTAAAQELHIKTPFTPERFAALQEQNALVLLDVFATWCPTCAQQQKVLVAYRALHPDVPLHILTIDFDNQKEFVRKYGAPRQSTLILYRGEEQVWFGVAETRAEVIFAELNKAAQTIR
jgi:thiol-disulfide isomerase/thioredoxin